MSFNPDESELEKTKTDANNIKAKKRVILNFLDPKKPILPAILGGTGNSVAAMDIDTSNTTLIYVDEKNHFDDQGQLKPLDELPEEYKELIDADKVDVLGHGSAGSGLIASDCWAYNFENPYLSWCPSPFPRYFGTYQIAPILLHCKKSPEVELVVCEGAKESIDDKGTVQKSLVDRLNDRLHQLKEDKHDVELPSKIVGYQDTISLTGFGDNRCEVWIPITPVEKFSANLILSSAIIPGFGPLVAKIITGLLTILEKAFRALFSLIGWCDSNAEIEAKRKKATKDSVVEKVVVPQSQQPSESNTYSLVADTLGCTNEFKPDQLIEETKQTEDSQGTVSQDNENEFEESMRKGIK